jgi:hypothetical protein
MNELEYPIDALEPIFQYTLEACAPFCKINDVAVAVVNDEAVWKIHTAFEFPLPSNVTVDVEILIVPDPVQ